MILNFSFVGSCVGECFDRAFSLFLRIADDGLLSYVPTGDLRVFLNIEDWLKYSLPPGTSNTLFQSVWRTLVLDPACDGTPHWGKAGERRCDLVIMIAIPRLRSGAYILILLFVLASSFPRFQVSGRPSALWAQRIMAGAGAPLAAPSGRSTLVANSPPLGRATGTGTAWIWTAAAAGPTRPSFPTRAPAP